MRLKMQVCSVLFLSTICPVHAGDPFILTSPESVAGLSVLQREALPVQTAVHLFEEDVFLVSGKKLERTTDDH